MYQLFLLNTNPSQKYWYRKAISHDTLQSQTWNIRLCYIVVDCIEFFTLLCLPTDCLPEKLLIWHLATIAHSQV